VDACACPIVTPDEFGRMIQGGVTAANWTIVGVEHGFEQAVRDITKWYSVLRKNEDKIMHVTAHRDIREAKQKKRLGIIFGLQDPRPIEDDLSFLEVLHRLGVRIMQLTYNERNRIGDGAGEKTDCGLSSLGVRVIEEMNRLGILIDISHCGAKTGMETIEISKDPVVFSHANPKALCNSVRNKSDEELLSIAEKGGVVGANAWGPAFWSKAEQPPTIDDYLNHIDYMVKLIGIDHVGIGMDISEGVYTKEQWETGYKVMYPQVIPSWFTFEMKHPRDLNGYLHFPNITRGLVGRGYSEEEIKKILGENFQRVFERSWR